MKRRFEGIQRIGENNSDWRGKSSRGIWVWSAMGARKRREMPRHLLDLLKLNSSSLTTTKPNPKSNNLTTQERTIAGRLTTAKSACKTHLQSNSFSKLVMSKNLLLLLLQGWSKPRYSLRRTSGWRRWWLLTLSKDSPIRQATIQTSSL